jgi:two-component system alkaline phosphatase synthesis response regulator PhoP
MKRNRTSYAGGQTGGKAQSRASHSNRILVVDDEIAIRLLISDALVRSGYHVDTAEDGEIGWEAIQSKSYDLLITDNNMPKVSGLELVKKLRSADLALPVILVSGAIPTEELNRNPGLQLSATLPKPFTDHELLGTVKKVLCKTDSTRAQDEPEPIWQSHRSVHSLPV